MLIYRADVLVDKVHIQWHVPSVSQIIFSTSCSHYISPYENLSQTQLVELLDKSGGTEGHAKLYLLPLNQLQQAEVAPDSTCFTALSKFPYCFYCLLTHIWYRIYCGRSSFYYQPYY